MSVFLSILYPVMVISGMGILFGIGLGYASKVFHVPVDETVEKIKEALPGANCGGCGFVGCADFAAAVASGNAKSDGCPVGGQKTNIALSEILGIEPMEFVHKTAYVKCSGSLSKTEFRYDYYGMDDCVAAQALAGGGSKSCQYGCLGNGSCVRKCPFNAISLVDGIAFIDKEKCTQCGLCVKACPRSLIELVPYDNTIRVACQSKEAAKVARAQCTVACIGCKLCVKACQFDAVNVTDNIAKIDYNKCTLCGECVKKCPTKAIKDYLEKI